MNPNLWLEKAERLRSELARLRDAQRPENECAHDEPQTLERVTIAKFLRQEFSDEPPEDTRTGLLFELRQ